MGHVQDFTGQVEFILLLCNVAHVFHQGIPKGVGAEAFFCSYKKL